MKSFIPLCLLLTCAAADVLAADHIVLPLTQDNSIVMVDSEWDLNAGQQARIGIKANQHIVAMKFDTSAIAGRRIKSATLVCAPDALKISGVSVSTIATAWDERRSTGRTAGMPGCDGWGYPGARLPAVCGGNAFTMVHSVTSELRDGHYHWEVPPDMVHAMAIDVAHGLAIHEHDADTGRNPTIFSREQSGRKPYLLVELSDQPDTMPDSPTDLQVTAADGTSARLTVLGPRNGFAYDINIDGHPTARCQR